MNVLFTTVFTAFLNYGYPMLWFAVFIAAVGAPLPIALVLLATGAFATLGDFNFFFLLAITISASVAGDNIGYLVGRKWGSQALNWLEQSRLGKRLLSPNAISRSRAYFNKHGGWAVFLTRFLVAALGGIVNLVAGSELFPYRAFLAYDIAGETIGAVLPLMLGFIFGASWEAVGDIFGAISFFIIAMLVALLVLLRLVRYIKDAKREHAMQITSSQKVTHR